MADSRHAERVRQQQREQWGAFAPAWQKHASESRGVPGPFVEDLIRMARIAPGFHVLDVASGLGEPALTIARRVESDGTVLGLDITAAMVAGARAEAAAMGLSNASFRHINSERELMLDAAAVDAATCRHGLMYMPDPAGALAAIRTALRPGGRVAVSTVGWPERNALLWLPLTIIRRHLSLPPLDLDAPGPFALSTPEKVRALLEGSGFADVVVEPHEHTTVESASPGTYWDVVTVRSAPIMSALAGVPDATRQAIRDDTVRTLAEMFSNGPITLGEVALIASGSNLG
jgi:SAM-dependent methyltransferase